MFHLYYSARFLTLRKRTSINVNMKMQTTFKILDTLIIEAAIKTDFVAISPQECQVAHILFPIHSSAAARTDKNFTTVSEMCICIGPCCITSKNYQAIA